MYKRSKKFDDLVPKAHAVVQEWAKSVADQIPVPLHKLAKERNIRYIRFEPLISTSCLLKANDGYGIFVNTEATNPSQIAGTIQEIENSDWSNLEKQLLFSIAHEIAHVIFLDVAGGNQKIEFLRNHERRLESECSKMARMLLIPKMKLIREIGDKLFDINHIKTLVTLFGVSPEVFVRRLQLDDMKDVLKDARGLVAFALIEKECIIIKACQIWGDLAWSRFAVDENKQKVPEGSMLRELPMVDFDEVNTWLLENEKGQRSLEVPWARDSFLPCELNFCKIQRNPNSLLIGIRITGDIEKRTM